jgi:aspartate aminotransferase
MRKISKLAENIVGSEILKISAEVNQRIKSGQNIYNLTVGDFDPEIFPIPDELKSEIVKQILKNQTNYPPSEGILQLRESVSFFLKSKYNLDYTSDEVLIAGGARPVIYSIFRTLVDPDDKVFFATPSWNNNHYTYLNSAQQVIVETRPENNFLPTADDIRPYISELSLISLCSPQNPTGTTFTKDSLTEICDIIIEENKRRGDNKPVYLMYDQIYSELTFGKTIHYNPVSLRPEMKEWTIFVDGISKSLSATGVRVGWSFGPESVIGKMKSILTHVGAWAPKAEQIATAKFLLDTKSYNEFLTLQKNKISSRLFSLYNGLIDLQSDGYPINVIKPEAAIYLTCEFNLIGHKDKNGLEIKSVKDITNFFLEKASIAIVPFYAFGTSEESCWFRISVGTLREHRIIEILKSIKLALDSLEIERHI